MTENDKFNQRKQLCGYNQTNLIIACWRLLVYPVLQQNALFWQLPIVCCNWQFENALKERKREGKRKTIKNQNKNCNDRCYYRLWIMLNLLKCFCWLPSNESSARYVLMHIDAHRHVLDHGLLFHALLSSDVVAFRKLHIYGMKLKIAHTKTAK